jgi:hypothetical protein
MAFRQVRFGKLKTDFWGLGESTGRIVPAAEGPHYSIGPIMAKLTVHNRGDVSGKTYFREVWGIRIYAVEERSFWLFDVEVKLVPVDPERSQDPSSAPLEMIAEQIHYGGMSFRGPSDWLHQEGRDVERALSQGIEFPGVNWLPPEEQLDVITSQGRTRDDGDGEAARWIDYTGPVEEGWGGLAMFGHPENPRSPLPVRIHPELPYFSWALTQKEPLTVRSDQPLVQRFRVLVHDDRPDLTLNELIGSDYELPTKVKFVPAG